MKKTFLLLCIACLTVCSHAQPEFKNILLENKVYMDGIGSVTLRPVGMLHRDAIVSLGQGEGSELSLQFDDLEEESRYFKYTFIHCTHDWKISDMNPIEYIDGFMEDVIEQYDHSFNTMTHYIHYSLQFPTPNMSFTLSGNYILFVYDDTPDNPVLTRRFMVTEPETVGIEGHVHAASDVNDRFTKQEVD